MLVLTPMSTRRSWTPRLTPLWIGEVVADGTIERPPAPRDQGVAGAAKGGEKGGNRKEGVRCISEGPRSTRNNGETVFDWRIYRDADMWCARNRKEHALRGLSEKTSPNEFC